MALNEKTFLSALSNIDSRALSRYNQALDVRDKQRAVRDFYDGFISLSKMAKNDNSSDNVQRVVEAWSQRAKEAGFRPLS